MVVAIHYLLRVIDEGDKDIAAQQTNEVVRKIAEEARLQRGASPDKLP